MNVFQKLYIGFIKCFIVPCEQASLLLTKHEFEKLSLRDAWRLRLHLGKCKYCRIYKREHSILSHTIQHTQKNLDKNEFLFCIDPKKIDEIKANIKS